eukprot:gene39631-48973_t
MRSTGIYQTGIFARKSADQQEWEGEEHTSFLAAKYCSEENRFTPLSDDYDVTVGCVGVATGKHTAEHLRECAGPALPGRWEPVVLEDGLNDPFFIEA